MTRAPCDSEALDLLVEQWVAKIAITSGTTVEAIVTLAENVRAALQELEPYGQKARQLLAARSALSRPMISKLETIGRHAQLLRRRASFLPPSVSSLYALARKPLPALERALMMDLRGKSRAEIKALFAPPSAPKPSRKLMTILVPPNLNEAARCLLIADIEVALVRISENRRVDVEASLPANGPKIEQVRDAQQAVSSGEQSSPQDRRQDNEPAEAGGDATDTKPLGHKERAGHAIAGGERPNFFTGENPSEMTSLETNAPSLRLSPLSALFLEREDIRQRLARLENSLMRRQSPPG